MRYILILLICLAFTGFNSAQTKPKTSTKKTSSAVKKKPAPKEINVYVCTSEKDKYYHKRSSCAGLNKCSTEIKNIKSPAILGKYKRKKCSRCFNM